MINIFLWFCKFIACTFPKYVIDWYHFYKNISDLPPTPYMPLWIFTFAWVCLAVNSTFRFSMTFVIKFMTLSAILYIFSHSVIQVLLHHMKVFLLSIHTTAKLFAVFWPLWRYTVLYRIGNLVPLWHPFCPSGNSSWQSNE